MTSISPTAGPTTGGMTVTITGTGFAGATAVTFGATAATGYTVNSNTQITATAPAGAAGTVDIRVTTVGGTSSTSAADQFTYVAAPTVTSISPTAGPTAGGTTVIITGTGFASATAVRFGATAATGYTVNSNTQITATAPAGAAGTVDIRVTTAGGTSSTSAADQFTYVAAPTVTSISPTAGPTTGGMTVTITGTGFAGATAVTFGATAATGYTVNSNTQITATAPAGAAGTVDIRVTTVGGTSSTSAADQFTYVAAPTVTSISPTAGPTAGGTTVTITGTGFASATAVTFGATAASGFTINSNTQITATAPAGAAGTVDIRVTTAGGTSATSAADQFTYAAPPVAGSFTFGATTPYNDGSNASQLLNLSSMVSNNPTSYTVGSATTAGGGSVSIDSSGQVTYVPPVGFRNANDSFTYTATNLGGTSNSATVTLPIGNPTLTVSIPSTTAIVGMAYNTGGASATILGGNASYTVNSVSGLPAGMANSGDVLSGTPTVSGTFPVTFNITDSSTGAGPYTANATATLTVSLPSAPVASAFTAPALAYNTGTASASTFSLAGYATNNPTSYAVGSATSANGGAVSVDSAGLVMYTPPVGFRGNDSFTFTATNPGGTSSVATVTVPVNNPVFSVTLPASSGTVGGAYNSGGAVVSISGGTGPYSNFSASGLPAGLSISSSGVISGTPTTAGNATVTITATDSSYGIGAFTSTASASVSIAAPTMVISPASLSNAAIGVPYGATLSNSGGLGPVTFEVTAGSLPAGLVLATDGTISGTSTAGGSYNFTVSATDSATAPGPYTGARAYTLTVDAATIVLSPAAGALPNGMTGIAYSQTVSASGGTAPYSYDVTVGALPTGLTLAANGTLSGTPSASGTFNFTITGTDSSSGSGPYAMANAYTLTVASPTLALTPAAGTLPAGTVGTAHSQTFTASNGTAPYSYAITGGSLPNGLTLSAAGIVSGTPTADGNYSFDVTATDAYGATGSAAYALLVKAPVAVFAFTPPAGNLGKTMAGEAYSQQIKATGGTAPLLYSLASGDLPKGMVLNVSTGDLTGPLDATSAGNYTFKIAVRDNHGATGSATYALEVAEQGVTVSDRVMNVPAGGSPTDVYLNDGATGGPFTSAETTFVEPANAGTAKIIRGQVAQAGPVSGPVGWYLQFAPNPTFSGAAKVGYRLTSALGTSNVGTITYNLHHDVQQVAEDINALVHGFVETRQGLIADGIYVPGLLERRQMAQATDAVTARMTPSQDGMTASFSTSLSQLNAARDSADGVEGAVLSPFNVWIDGAFLAHKRDQNGGKWGSFAILNLGADYLISEKALVGLSFHYDRMTDPSDVDAELTGNGWLAGPYASLEIGKGVFWDTSLLYGGSGNDIDTAFWDGSFDTQRWMIDTAVMGEWQIGEATTLTPKLRAVYFNETVEDYTVRNKGGDELTIEGFDAEQFRVSLGAEIARSFTLESDVTVTPKLGVTAGYAGLDGSGVYGSITAGVALQTTDFWMLELSLLLDIEGDGQKSIGGSARAGRQF
ncbi:IPT/TIG domain-containing protein [Sinorhizobium sp. A49]|uniref:IPT/TIG domain-containing protein n=1 Tax=Sinorhizobium sp. A49 TaxID=1945861 RepID=UPI002477DF8E|nr:IPT/TIG domain-containing protein [Sinorhizobium sp. A49]